MIILYLLSYLRSAILILCVSLCLVCSGYAADPERVVTLQWDHSIDYPYIQSYKVYYYTISHIKGSLNNDLDGATSCTVGVPPCIKEGPITIDKQNTQITLTFKDTSKYYYFAVSSVDYRGLEGETTDEISHPLLRLSVAKQGTGRGRVTASPGVNSVIDCGTGCSSDNADYAHGTPVTLTATADPGYAFTQWGGACSGTALTCDSVTMDVAKSVIAMFMPLRTLTVTKLAGGEGTVTSSPSGIGCGPGCIDFVINTSATLTATPDPGYAFIGWGDACSGTGQCVVTMSSPNSVTARFTPVKGDINLDGSVNLTDAILIFQVLSRTFPTGINWVADTNSDGKLGLADAIYILQKIAGLR
jgi:hypothetical protein